MRDAPEPRSSEELVPQDPTTPSGLGLPTVDEPARVAVLADAPGPGGARRRSRQALRRGLGMLLAGVVLMLLGVLVDEIVVVVRAVVFLAGVAALLSGLGRVCRATLGEESDPGLWLCVGWVVVLVAAAVFAPLLPLAEHADLSATIDAPAYARPSLLSEHPLGTNNFGLDLLARVIYGARTSLMVGLAAVLIGLVVGGGIGILAGYFGRAFDSVVGVLTNALLAIPSLVLLIALSTVLEPNVRNLSFALALLAIPSMVRLARANTMAFAQREFVLAARAMGASRWRIMSRELLPNVALPLVSMAMVMISMLIVAEASLSFLGLGVQQPTPTWGNMIAEGEGNVVERHPHVVLVPGATLFLTVFAFNLIGERARRRWDTRSAKL